MKTQDNPETSNETPKRQGRGRAAKFDTAGKLTLPIYASMRQCQAATGIPVSAQKEAMKRGCSAFAFGRVDIEKLLRFVFTSGNSDIGSWDEHFKEARSKREWLRLQREEGATVDRGMVRDGIAQLAGAIDSSIEKVFVNEFPPACMGLDALGVSVLAKEYKGRVWDIIKAQAEAIQTNS